jgi:hypothetical protein
LLKEKITEIRLIFECLTVWLGVTLITLGWKIALILLGITGLSSGISHSPGFWTSYVLDMVGPAWNYILIRGIYNSKYTTFFSIKFSPETAAVVIIGICFLIETSQYFKLYEARFDPYDFLAYLSLLLPCYILDKWTLARQSKDEDIF